MPLDTCALCTRLSNHADPARIISLDESTVFLADNQGCPGWCTLILHDHHEHLAELPAPRQLRLFSDVARVANAIRAHFPTSGRFGQPPRINYECLGNQAPHIHWHVIPRHADDPDPRNAIWGWPAEQLRGSLAEDGRRELVASLRALLAR